MKLRLIFGVLALFLFASVLRADDITVTTSSAGWVQIAPNTFVLPADLTGIGCGSENETTCEPVGVFNLNAAFSCANCGVAVFNVLDPAGGTSDALAFGTNSGGFVDLFSDPNVPANLIGAPAICTESDTGCVVSFSTKFADGSTLTITGAFDGEGPFDPFGAGFDTSDGIKFTTTGVPEPGSFALLASGLLALVGIVRKRMPR